MNIIDQIQIISLVLALGFVVVTIQVFSLRYIYKSRSWLIGSLAFLALGAKQVVGYVRLPAAFRRAQELGIKIPDHLDWEQILNIVWAFVIVGLFILWLFWMRRDLRNNMGV